MANKISVLVLGLLIIVPYLNAAPAVSSSEEDGEMLLKQVFERFKIFALAVEELDQMFKGLSTEGPTVFKAVLDDPNVTVDKSEEMQKYLQELRDYIKKSEQAKKENEKNEAFDMYEEYNKIVDKFDSTKHKDLSDAAEAVERSLNENGTEVVEKSAAEHFEAFFKKFNKEIDEYAAGLNEKEKANEKEFLAWSEKLKNEKDLEKKIEMLDGFLDTDSDECESKEE